MSAADDGGAPGPADRADVGPVEVRIWVDGAEAATVAHFATAEDAAAAIDRLVEAADAADQRVRTSVDDLSRHHDADSILEPARDLEPGDDDRAYPHDSGDEHPDDSYDA